jgi:metal-responsive CopG/Arc/MetJ family transcriptional regulator
VKIGISLPDELITFADQAAARRGTSRSGLLAQLLAAEQVKEAALRYLDQYGWDIAEDDAAWQAYQRQRMAEEYAADDW